MENPCNRPGRQYELDWLRMLVILNVVGSTPLGS